MANVKEAVWLGRKAGDRYRVLSALLILVNNLPDKIKRFAALCLIVHVFSCHLKLTVEFWGFSQAIYYLFTTEGHQYIKHGRAGQLAGKYRAHPVNNNAWLNLSLLGT